MEGPAHKKEFFFTNDDFSLREAILNKKVFCETIHDDKCQGVCHDHSHGLGLEALTLLRENVVFVNGLFEMLVGASPKIVVKC